MTVLIADDDPIIRLDLKQMLESLDYEVVAEAGMGLELAAVRHVNHVGRYVVNRGGAVVAGARGAVAVPGKSGVPGELHLIGRTTDEARDLLEKYLDDAFLAGLTTVRIIHGKGTGALRRAVEDLLDGHPLIAEHRPGAASEGGGGATVATLTQG